MIQKRLRWSRSSVLAFGTQVRGFKPGRSRRIFQSEKILSTLSFGREVKPFVPCRRFTACKKIPDCYVEVGHFQTKFIGLFSPKYFLLSLLGYLVEKRGGASRNDYRPGFVQQAFGCSASDGVSSRYSTTVQYNK